MKKYLLILLAICIANLSVDAQNLSNSILYSRNTLPNGSVWLNDGNGMDTMLFLNGCAPKISDNGQHFLYMKNTVPVNWAYGGQWTRHDMLSNSDVTLFNNSDYIVGYDFLNADSSIAVSYSCGLYYKNFNGVGISTIPGVNCYDDGPDIRQSDSMMVWHNIQTNIYIEKLPSGGVVSVPNTNGNSVWPVWSPDGNWILFCTNNNLIPEKRLVNLFKIKANGDSLTQLTFNNPTDTGIYTAVSI